MGEVVSIFSRKKKEEPTEKKELSFEEQTELNRQNEERLKKERAKANQDVLKSYRIK
jgi:hypothetical protein